MMTGHVLLAIFHRIIRPSPISAVEYTPIVGQHSLSFPWCFRWCDCAYVVCVTTQPQRTKTTRSIIVLQHQTEVQLHPGGNPVHSFSIVKGLTLLTTNYCCCRT